jgi:hypothetical protein
VVLISYAGAAALGVVGLLVMSISQDLALILSSLTMLGLGILAVALTKVNMSTSSSSLYAGDSVRRNEVEKPHPV